MNFENNSAPTTTIILEARFINNYKIGAMPHDTQSGQLQRILFKFYQKYLRFGEILSTVVAGLVSVIAPQQQTLAHQTTG
jgi:hypothetical protein